MSKRPLTEVLWEGEKDLITILVSSGINCKTCYINTQGRGWSDGGFICRRAERESVFCSCPELNLCLDWRQRKTEEVRDETD